MAGPAGAAPPAVQLASAESSILGRIGSLLEKLAQTAPDAVEQLGAIHAAVTANIAALEQQEKAFRDSRAAMADAEVQAQKMADLNRDLGNSFGQLSGDASAIQAELDKTGGKARVTMQILHTEMMPATEEAKRLLTEQLDLMKNVSETQRSLIAESPNAMNFLANMKAQYETGMLSLSGYSQMLHYAIDQLEQLAAKSTLSLETTKRFRDMADAIRELLKEAMNSPAPQIQRFG